MIAASAYPSGGNAQFDSKPSKANRLLGFEQPAADGCNSATGKPASTKNLNNLLADDGDDGKASQGEQPGLIQQLLNFFFSKLWSPATSDAEKLGWTYVYAEDSSLLAEYGEGSAATSGSAQYLWLPTANGPMPIAAVVNGQTYAVHSDHLNTPRKLTQANGQAVWQWAYSAFGDEQPTTAAKRFTSEMTVPTTGTTSIPDVTFNLRYPGQYFDKETGLHYNYFRTYAPGTGRYTQADPIGLDGGWNRFGYVEGNATKYADPFGLAIKCETVVNLGLFAVQKCTEDGSIPSEQDAKDAKRMGGRELDKACRANGFDDAHHMKRELGLNSKSDIFADGKGNMYAGPRQGSGTPEYIHMNTNGITPAPTPPAP